MVHKEITRNSVLQGSINSKKQEEHIPTSVVHAVYSNLRIEVVDIVPGKTNSSRK